MRGAFGYPCAIFHVFLDDMTGRVHANPLPWLFRVVNMVVVDSLPNIRLYRPPVESFSQLRGFDNIGNQTF